MMLTHNFIITIVVWICVVHPSFEARPNECTSPACVQSARRMRAMMDESAAPCDDFHQYACGSFFKERKIPQGQTATGSFFDVTDKDTIKFKELLNDDVKRTDKDSFESKMKTLYQSCLNTGAMETHGLKDYKDSYRLDWPTLNSDWTPRSYSLQSTTNKYLQMFSKALFSFYLKLHYKGNNGKYILQIEESSFSVMGMELKTWKKYYRDIAMALGADRGDAKRDGHKVATLIRNLSKNSALNHASLNANVTTNPSTLGEMNKKYPYLDWVQAFNAIYNKMGITVDGSQQVNLHYPKYLEGLKTALDKTDKRTVQNFFAFFHAESIVFQATKKMRKIFAEFEGYPQMPRDEYCVDEVVSLYNVGMAKLISYTRYSQKAKNFMDKMIANLKKAAIANINKLKWMGRATKQKAVLKIRKMKAKIGIQSQKFTDKDIDEHYKDFKVHENTFNTDLLQNKLQMEVNDLKDLNKPIKDWRWIVPMTDVNAYYLRTANELIFPLGIMQPPFFDQNNPSYFNYGAIGYFIGHEMGHGFDISGRLYDERGRFTDWWTKDDTSKYNKKVKCFIDQYSQYFVEQIKLQINGNRSATENIADNLGISQAYAAYKKYALENPGELPLPELGLTNDQLFFLSAAQTWCLKRTDESLRYRLTYRSFAAEKYRNIGMMQNSQDFSKAFNCKVGDYMNPPSKCTLW